MKRVLIAAVAAVSVVVGINAASFAALPKADSTYKGTVEEQNGATGTITIKSGTKHMLKLVKAKNSCGEVSKVRNVPVGDDGRFKKEIVLENFGVTIWTVKGKFKSKSKAKGTITEVACSGNEAKFSALLQ